MKSSPSDARQLSLSFTAESIVHHQENIEARRHYRAEFPNAPDEDICTAMGYFSRAQQTFATGEEMAAAFALELQARMLAAS